MTVFSFALLPLQAADKFENSEFIFMVESKDDLVGGWEFTAAGAPEGFDSGFMLIVKIGKTYKVQVQTAAGTFNASDVAVKGSKITFNLSVEGEKVAVALAAKGSKLTGTSTSSTGVFNMVGIKSLSPQ